MIAAVFPDVRRRSCARCGTGYLPPGAGGGMCSDQCWMAARSRRQPGQAEELGRAFLNMSAQQEDRIAGRARVGQLLRDAALRSDVEAYKRDRREVLALIGRSRARRPSGPGAAVRAADCADCSKLGVTVREAAEIHRLMAADAATRVAVRRVCSASRPRSGTTWAITSR